MERESGLHGYKTEDPDEEACRREELGSEWDMERVDIRQTGLDTEAARIACLGRRASRLEEEEEGDAEEERRGAEKRVRLLSRACVVCDEIREVADTVNCA